MLFNSYIFVLVFLPACFGCFWLAERTWGIQTALRVGIVFSFIFYAYWSVEFAALLATSIAVNFALGAAIRRGRARKALLAAGVAGNLGLIGYFKYANFFLENFAAVFGASPLVLNVVLPIGISFFTFQQIAYLVDVYEDKVATDDPTSYAFFVSFFPQLIAGPIVHHTEIIGRIAAIRFQEIPRYAAVGITIFSVGLLKKVVLADGAAVYADQIFNNLQYGLRPDLIEAWTAALAYTFQLYFDFSAYSDMAIGAAFLLGFRLPVNFASPYKAASVTEFWRRWHVTLSRFLRDYVYIPLGGNRHGTVNRYRNILITMALGDCGTAPDGRSNCGESCTAPALPCTNSTARRRGACRRGSAACRGSRAWCSRSCSWWRDGCCSAPRPWAMPWPYMAAWRGSTASRCLGRWRRRPRALWRRWAGCTTPARSPATSGRRRRWCCCWG